jgi:hypothetical protein
VLSGNILYNNGDNSKTLKELKIARYIRLPHDFNPADFL